MAVAVGRLDMNACSFRQCAVSLAVLVACKQEDPKPEPVEQEQLAPGEACDPDAVPVDAEGATTTAGDETMPPPICAPGLACEPLADGDGHVCGAAFSIRGRVTDALSGAALPDALVAALDETGEPVTDVVITDSCGDYVLPVSITRNADGGFAETPVWTLFVTAADHEPFPAAPRPALPLDFADAVPNPDPPPPNEDAGDTGETMAYVDNILANAATSVALLPNSGGGVTVSGVITGEAGAGTLVVAEGGPAPAPYGIADASGNFTIFNVPSEANEILGYRSGLEITPGPLTIASGDVSGIELVSTLDATQLGRVEGSLNIVNATGGSVTSVVLVPASVFDAALERGPVPLGLRDPPSPMPPDVASAFAIGDVPAGTYKILVAFENDGLVRDPDAGIAGTAILEVTVTPGSTVIPEAGFKVTAALAIDGPGNEAPELVEGTPTFRWMDDSSEDGYDVVVYDALGNTAWQTEVAGVSGSDIVELAYAGDPLTVGMYYQFRVTSWREMPGGKRLYISRTEDLRGVFFTGAAAPAADCEPDDATGADTSSGA